MVFVALYAATDSLAAGHDDVELEVDELPGQRREPLFLSIREAGLEIDRLAGDIAELGEPCLERLERPFVLLRGRRPEVTDARDELLGAPGEGPSGGGGKRNDELPPSHSITSSAPANRIGGVSTPSA